MENNLAHKTKPKKEPNETKTKQNKTKKKKNKKKTKQNKNNKQDVSILYCKWEYYVCSVSKTWHHYNHKTCPNLTSIKIHNYFVLTSVPKWCLNN